MNNINVLLRQRVRSIRLLETEPVTAKRFITGEAAEKGPKSEQSAHTPSCSAHLDNIGPLKSGTDVPKWLKRLNVLAQLKTNQKARSLWALVNESDLWCAAYAKLAASRGSLTRGGDQETIDAYSMKILNALKTQIIQGQYQFGLTRRVFIPKPQGGKRPLGVPAFRDRVVQEVIRIILETIFEPRFSPNSHGFRPGRSQHTCMRQIRRDFRATKWFIEGHISKCFDQIDHQSLRKLLQQRIDDKRFIKFVCQGLRTKVLMPDREQVNLKIGTAQGSICSPLLSNIALNPLDRFMQRLKKRIDRGLKRKQNPQYTKAHYGLNKAKREAHKAAVAYYRKQSRKVPSGLPNDPNFLRLSYVRYADDFLIGVIGPYKLATRVKALVQRFLHHRLKLSLNEDKTLITPAKGNTIGFLGFRIQHAPTIAMKFWRRYQGKWRQIRSIRDGHIRLLADTRKVIKDLAEKRFCDKSGKAKPNWVYFHDPQSYAISKASSIIRGLDNYYNIANNKRRLTNSVMSIIRSSMAKLFAAKFKLRTQASVYARGGKDLSRPLKAKTGRTAVGKTDAQAQAWAEEAGGRLTGPMPPIPYTKYATIRKPKLAPLPVGWQPETMGPMQQHGHMTFLENLWGRSGRGRTALQAHCAMCASTAGVEMHHVRKMTDLQHKSPVEKLIIAANRKSIPLCWFCHKKHHGWKQ